MHEGSLNREAPALWQALSALGRRARRIDEPARGSGPETARIPAAEEILKVFLRRADAGQAPPGSLTREELATAVGDGFGAAGSEELRRRWRDWQRRALGEEEAAASSTLPLVTSGLSHGLSLAAELFVDAGRAVAVAEPFWGNYRQVFAVRQGGRLLAAPAYRAGRSGPRFDPAVFAAALAGLPEGEPAVVVLNLPSNPGGYSPTPAERAELLASLRRIADARPLVVVCDDAYAGLVFEDEIPRGSLFWELARAHPRLVAVKVDGGTKEFSFFGGRVGFLTFALPSRSGAARELEDKLEMLVRSGLGQPPAASQAVLLAVLRRPLAELERQVEEVRQLLASRYRALRQALRDLDPALLGVLPFNSGCFALVELPPGLGVSSETLRRHLLARHGTGLISIAPRYLRIAHCSVTAEAMPELGRRLQRAVAELAGGV